MIRRIKSRVKYYEGRRVLILNRRTRHYGRFGIMDAMKDTERGRMYRVVVPDSVWCSWCLPSDLATEAEVRLATQEGDT